MTYQEFKEKYNGKYVDFDGEYGPQCWDLIQFYDTEVIDVPAWVFDGCGWAGEMLVPPKREALDQYFDEVDTHAMQQGDVCIWRNPNNEKDCHVAIYDHYDINDNNCYYFSQNPNPCQVIPVNKIGHHAFRRKQEPKEGITQPVERNETKNQIEVLIDDLRVRACGSMEGDVLGYAKPGFYNYYEVVDNGYKWYRITNDNRSQWIASKEGEWTKVYPAKEDEYVKFKVLEKKDGYALVDMGKVWVKE